MSGIKMLRAAIQRHVDAACAMQTIKSAPREDHQSIEHEAEIAERDLDDVIRSLESAIEYFSAHGAKGDTSWYEGQVDREVVKEIIDLNESQADAEGKS